jgi:hypothetical protein
VWIAPDGLSFPRSASEMVWVRAGPRTGTLSWAPPVQTDRTVHPGDRIVVSCHADDPHGRELCWWLHPFNRPRGRQVRGQTVELTWRGGPRHRERVYLGTGLAAQLPYHHHGGRNEQG